MKIGIISSYTWIKRENNYGALLQYYALQKYLEDLNHEVFWIRYNPKLEFSGKRSRLRIFISKLKRKMIAILRLKISIKIKQCHRNFENFLSGYINLSAYEYKTLEELTNNPPEADLYITGSDQVWLGLEKANYLEFISNNKKKFSYGASFGKSSFTPEEKAEIKTYLKKFNKISVREIEGVDLCKELGREDALQVIDPTMLLDKTDYLNVNPESKKQQTDTREYILCYFLNVYDSKKIHYKDILKYISANSLDLKIVPVQGPEYLFPDKYVSMPSPENWLHEIENSKALITNSFHGTVFSIIMRKPFLVVLQSGSTSVQNCRFLSLLERFGLENRIYDPSVDMKQQIAAPIDWKKVDIEQGEFVKLSAEFLNLCIQESK